MSIQKYSLSLHNENTKIKDSWTREEVESKCYEAYKAGIQQGIDPSPKPFTKWIEENL